MEPIYPAGWFSASSSLFTPLVAGGVAGAFTDTMLFPLDTVKTRLQAGGGGSTTSPLFRHMYRGIGPAALVAAPSAATFFAVYDFGKLNWFSDTHVGHGGAAAVAEIAACLVKVPFEILKQRKQADAVGSAWALAKSIYQKQGVRGMYAGLGATVAREIPFGFIQMPLYEWLKKKVKKNDEELLTNPQACACGAVAGGVAAFATCPVDVWKTRLMLGEKNASVWKIGQQEGLRALFSGALPRVVWISLGGSLFFGAYEWVRERIIAQKQL